ncbi:MAG: YkvA family protein [Planctomycetota bacterium]|nr:YkvA family protein [Planctomycetota bacterium]
MSELRAFLDGQGLSPERLAERTGVSNMTWRRLLARPDATLIPEKYRAVLLKFGEVRTPELDPQELVLSGLGGSEDAVLESVARDGERTTDVDVLVRDVERKRATARALPRRLSTALADLLGQLPKSTLGTKALVVGALLYFLNPLDLVADALIGIGFLDDVGITVLVLKRLAMRRGSKEKLA